MENQVSHEANQQLLERAAEMVTYFEGKLPAELIEQDLLKQDMESLYLHVAQAEGLASQQEFEANDTY